MQITHVLRGKKMGVVIAALLLVSALFFGIFFVLQYRSSLTLERLQRAYIPGTHGVVLISPQSIEPLSFEPWHALEQNRSLESMLERLCTKAGLPRACAQEEGARFQIFTKKHLISRNGVLIELERNDVPVPDEITRAFLGERLTLISEWAEANQREDGSFPYLYSPSRGEYPLGNNIIRNMITVQGIYAIGDAREDRTATANAKEAEALIMQSSYRPDTARGIAYMVEEGGEIKLGASALTILALRQGTDAAAPLSQEEELLGAFLLSMQREDGSFQTYLQKEWTDENERFYSGEALTALARLAQATGDEKYYTALEKSFPHYRTKLEADFYPQYAPWHIQAYTIAYQHTHNEAYAEYVYWLADRLIETMLEEDRDALQDEEGRFYNLNKPEWGVAHSSSTGIYTEGLTYAYELARDRGDTQREKKYREAVLSGTRFLLTVQWTKESAYYLEHKERVVGAFKRTVTDNRHRIDQLGHAANALARVYTVVLK